MPVHNRVAAIPDPANPGGWIDWQDALAWQGPILPVQIEVPDALANQLQANNQPVPQPSRGVALIDTGAGISGVDATVITALGIQPVGQANIAGVHGSQMRNKYPAKFVFPGTNLPSMHFGELVEAELVNQQIPGAQGPLIALIGRDILHHFVLIYNGPGGSFSLAC